MVSFDDIEILLDDIINEFPNDLFIYLNGGVNLLPHAKKHPDSNSINELYILGEYHNNFSMGRYIFVYYGSFIKMFGNLTMERQKVELKRILLHEFTHHLESLAGENGLEIKDREDLLKYKRRYL